MQQKLPRILAPAHGVEEDVVTPLLARVDVGRRAVPRVLLHPLAQLRVEAPVAAEELLRRELLQHVARVLVEDGEEGVVGEVCDLGHERRHVVDRVRRRQLEFGHDGPRGRVGEGSGEGWVEGAAVGPAEVEPYLREVLAHGERVVVGMDGVDGDEKAGKTVALLVSHVTEPLLLWALGLCG